MKRKNFIKFLIKSGCFLYRHGSKHDLYKNSINGKITAVPRHREIKESLVKLIKKQLEIE